MPTLQPTTFDRDAMARWYAKSHLKTDPGIVAVHYLPTDSGDKEIRFIEVNRFIGERCDDALEVIGFGKESAHQLLILDVTPAQWLRISQGSLALPARWSLDNAEDYTSPDQIDIEAEDSTLRAEADRVSGVRRFGVLFGAWGGTGFWGVRRASG